MYKVQFVSDWYKFFSFRMLNVTRFVHYESTGQNLYKMSIFKIAVCNYPVFRSKKGRSVLKVYVVIT